MPARQNEVYVTGFAYRRFRRMAALLLLPLFACDLWPTAPRLPRGAVRIDPLPQYASWWRLTERCARLTGAFRSLSWYVVPGVTDLSGENVLGMYVPDLMGIVLAETAVQDGVLIRHEMLHALVPIDDHPPEYFQRRCAGTVVCNTACIDDGGPLAPLEETGPVVSPSDLEIRSSVEPATPSVTRDSGWVAITIEVRNPRTHPVVLRLDPLPSGSSAYAFGVRLSACDIAPTGPISHEVWQDNTIVLRAGESLYRVYDYRFTASDQCARFETFFSGLEVSVVQLHATP